MANKKYREENLKKEREKQFNKAIAKLNPTPIYILVCLVLTILLFFVNFAYIHNTDMNNGKGGIEVMFSGFNIFFAGLTGNYSGTNYGDIAVPFYYYAGGYISSLGLLSVVTIFMIIAAIIVSTVTLITKKHFLCLIETIITLAQTILLIILYVTALSMKNSDILPIYCSGNPACSIRSSIIIPILSSLVALGISIFSTVRYFGFRKLLKK